MTSSKRSTELEIVISKLGGKTVKVKRPKNDADFREAGLKAIHVGRGSALTENEVAGFRYAVDGLVSGKIPNKVLDQEEIIAEWWRWHRYLMDSAFQWVPICSDEFNKTIGILIPRGELLRIAKGAGLSWPEARQETLPNLIDLWRAVKNPPKPSPHKKRRGYYGLTAVEEEQFYKIARTLSQAAAKQAFPHVTGNVTSLMSKLKKHATNGLIKQVSPRTGKRKKRKTT
jgi:hypothetical protein